MFNPKTKILVVDDMKTMRMVMKKCLKELGFENITEADDGESAWPLLDQDASSGQPYELILSDWNMPKVSGMELLAKCRQDDRYAKVPFVLITAESDKAQIMEAIKAGVSNYVVKPFTAEQVKDKLSAVYKRING